MKRFLMLVGVAVVAAAMYVAAAPGSQQASGPTAKQFKALKKQVTSLSKTVKGIKKVVTDCVQIAIPIDQFGDGNNQNFGYEYSTDGVPDNGTILTTALDAAVATDPTAVFFTGGDSTCGTLVNGSALRHAAAKAGIRLPHPLTHLPSFAAHRP